MVCRDTPPLVRNATPIISHVRLFLRVSTIAVDGNRRSPGSCPKSTRPGQPPHALLAYTKSFDHYAIPIDILRLQVIQKTPALSDHSQKTTAGMMVFGMSFEVVGQISDLFAQNCDLHLGRTRIGVVRSVAIDDLGLPLSRE
jgi:hypothetical protein